MIVNCTITAGASRVASDHFCLHAVAITPAGLMELVRSYCPISSGLPRIHGGLAPALIVSRPAQRSLTLRPACSPSRPSDPLHRRLRRLRYLCRRSDCYRVERTSSRAGLSPAVDQRFSRRGRNRDVTPNSPPIARNYITARNVFPRQITITSTKRWLSLVCEVAPPTPTILKAKREETT